MQKYHIIAGFIIAYFVGQNAILAAVPFFVIGFGFAGAIIANAVLIGDTIDNDEIITGKCREAIYGRVNAIITKPAISIGNWMFLFIITLFGFIEPIVVNGITIR